MICVAAPPPTGIIAAPHSACSAALLVGSTRSSRTNVQSASSCASNSWHRALLAHHATVLLVKQHVERCLDRHCALEEEMVLLKRGKVLPQKYTDELMDCQRRCRPVVRCNPIGWC